MRKYIILIILTCIYLNINAQNNISSVLYDSETKMPAIYANIGIFEKNVGTVSDVNGRFSLNIPDSLLDFYLSISKIGYETSNFNIRQLIKNEHDTMYINPKVEELQEVSIVSKKIKKKKIGHKGFGYNAIVYGFGNLGQENGTLIKIPKAVKKNTDNEVLAKDFNFKIESHGVDSLLFRLNIYSTTGGKYENILKDNIYIKVKNDSQGDFYTKEINFDLSQYNITFSDDVVVTLEIVEMSYTESKSDIINNFYIVANPYGEGIYSKYTSQSELVKENEHFSPGFWMTVAY